MVSSVLLKGFNIVKLGSQEKRHSGAFSELLGMSLLAAYRKISQYGIGIFCLIFWDQQYPSMKGTSFQTLFLYIILLFEQFVK